MRKYVVNRPDPEAMGRILEQAGPEGVVLRLAWQAGLTREEISALTWNQVSFLDNRLELPDRMVPLEPDLRAELWRLYEAQGDLSPRVVLSSRGKTPLAPESISRLARPSSSFTFLSCFSCSFFNSFIARSPAGAAAHPSPSTLAIIFTAIFFAAAPSLSSPGNINVKKGPSPRVSWSTSPARPPISRMPVHRAITPSMVTHSDTASPAAASAPWVTSAICP